MSKDVFQIKLNAKLVYQLRETVNNQQNISINKKYGKYRAWDRICAIMDRLEDTVDYLNHLELNTGRFIRSAFDFYDFMNNSAVIIDCIKLLTKIFEVPDDVLRNSNNTFNQLGNDGNGTDEKYFEYLRSLCSVHPTNTSRHSQFQDNEFECCPFVVWNDGKLWHDSTGDICAWVYTSRDGENHKKISIAINQVFRYVTFYYEFLTIIIDGISKYHQEAIDLFRGTAIRTKDDFEDYIDYLKNLNIELKERFGSDTLYSFDFVIDLFKLKLSNTINQNKLDKYKNALIYSITFEHNYLQNISLEGFDNSGIQYPDRNVETTLYSELCSVNSSSENRMKYGYEIGKISCLDHDSGYESKQFAYFLLKSITPFIEKNISLEGAKGDFEHYALVQVALYFDCLESKCALNKNIPNELMFRAKLLTNKEIEDLRAEEPIDESAGEELMEFINHMINKGLAE